MIDSKLDLSIHNKHLK